MIQNSFWLGVVLTNQNSSFDLCSKEKWSQRIPMNQKYHLFTRKNAKSSPDGYFSSEHMIILIPLFYNSDISGNTFDRKYKSKGCYFIWSRPVHLCKRPGTTKIGFMRTSSPKYVDGPCPPDRPVRQNSNNCNLYWVCHEAETVFIIEFEWSFRVKIKTNKFQI